MYTPLNDISRRDASLTKRNTIFQAYGNIPQVIMIDLSGPVWCVLNQPAYRQDDSDGPLSGARWPARLKAASTLIAAR